MTVGSAHATSFETLPPGVQVHVEGQSLSVVQDTATTWQDDVESVVVVQLGLDASTVGVVGVPGGDATEDPSVLPDADPADPPPEHSVEVSGTQVKPEPQSDATWQGRSYLGTHELDVKVLHPPASPVSTGAPQSTSGAQAGLLTPSAGQVTAESV
jgi:hypothetical protein